MLHVLAAVVWVGGALALNVLATRVRMTSDGARMAATAKDIEYIGMRLFIPTSLVLLVAGFGLVSTGDWDYEPWVVFGLAAFAFSFLVGALFLGPQSGKVGKLIAEHGPDHPDVAKRLGTLFAVSRIELVVLVLVVVAMTVKPGS